MNIQPIVTFPAAPVSGRRSLLQPRWCGAWSKAFDHLSTLESQPIKTPWCHRKRNEIDTQIIRASFASFVSELKGTCGFEELLLYQNHQKIPVQMRILKNSQRFINIVFFKGAIHPDWNGCRWTPQVSKLCASHVHRTFGSQRLDPTGHGVSRDRWVSTLSVKEERMEQKSEEKAKTPRHFPKAWRSPTGNRFNAEVKKPNYHWIVSSSEGSKANQLQHRNGEGFQWHKLWVHTDTAKLKWNSQNFQLPCCVHWRMPRSRRPNWAYCCLLSGKVKNFQSVLAMFWSRFHLEIDPGRAMGRCCSKAKRPSGNQNDWMCFSKLDTTELRPVRFGMLLGPSLTP